MAAVRRRGRWIRLPLPSALLYAVATSVVVAFTVAGALPVWAAVAILLGAAIALFIPIRGHVLLVEWFVVVGAFLRRRRRPLPQPLAPAVDISVISGEAGIRWDGATLVAAVEVGPTLALTRERSGRSECDSALPLELVASLMTQYGLTLDIDVVSSGRHVPPGTAYRTVYSQFVGPRPIIGQRRTWLVLRLNAFQNLDGIVERGPSRSAAPRALAAAAHRVVQRLQQDQIRAHALSAEELDALADVVLEPVGPVATGEKWTMIRSGPNFITTYIGQPAMLADGQLDQWWSWRTEDSLTTIRLTGAGPDTEIQVGVLIRYVHHGRAYRPLTEAKLSLPTGVQRPLLEAALPAGDLSLAALMPTAGLSAVAAVEVPIGPSGQILGQLDDGTLVAVPLWDQGGDPKRLRIDAHVGVEVARQLVLRAVVTGAVVALHTNDRQRWDDLVIAVNDDHRLFYATAGARTSDIAVFDGRAVSTTPSRSVLRLLPQGTAVGAADMTVVERPAQLLEVAVNGSDPITMWIIRTREEDRYLGLVAAEEPRRRVSTESTLTRTPRQPVPPPQPRHDPTPRPIVDAYPPQDGDGDFAGIRRRRNLAAPQRISRGPGQQPAQQRTPREFHLPPPQGQRPPDGDAQ